MRYLLRSTFITFVCVEDLKLLHSTWLQATAHQWSSLHFTPTRTALHNLSSLYNSWLDFSFPPWMRHLLPRRYFTFVCLKRLRLLHSTCLQSLAQKLNSLNLKFPSLNQVSPSTQSCRDSVWPPLYHLPHCPARTAHNSTLQTAHCTLHTAHYTLHTAHCTLHTAHYTRELQRLLGKGGHQRFRLHIYLGCTFSSPCSGLTAEWMGQVDRRTGKIHKKVFKINS